MAKVVCSKSWDWGGLKMFYMVAAYYIFSYFKWKNKDEGTKGKGKKKKKQENRERRKTE